MSNGILIVLSGPSGVGKDTLCNALRQSRSELRFSISATTRPQRTGERDGSDYYFKTEAQFLQMIEQDELLEWAQYAGHYYGTPYHFVRKQLEAGQHVILEIEVQGALKVREKFPDGVFIFLLPPTLEELRSRIEKRGTETAASIDLRMAAAIEEIGLLKHYDYAVVNDDIDTALAQIEAIITAESLRHHRKLPLINQWIAEVK